jgi:hypothetical protein
MVVGGVVVFGVVVVGVVVVVVVVVVVATATAAAAAALNVFVNIDPKHMWVNTEPDQCHATFLNMSA